MNSVSKKSLKRLLFIAAVIAVTLIALSARLTAVDKLPIDYDEDDYLRAGQIYATGIQQGDWSVFTRENYRTEHPPLTKIINGLVMAPLPPAPEIPDRPTTADPARSLPQPHLDNVRTAHAIFGTLEVLVLALINPLAGLVLALHTWTIKYTSQVMLEALPALTSLLVVVFYLKSRRKKSFNLWTLLSAIMLGLTTASKYPYTMVGVAVLMHWLWDSWPGRSDEDNRSIWQWLRPILAWGSIAVIVFFLADPYLWPDPINRLRDSIGYHGRYATTAAEVQEANFPIWQPLVWLAQSVPWHPGVFADFARRDHPAVRARRSQTPVAEVSRVRAVADHHVGVLALLADEVAAVHFDVDRAVGLIGGGRIPRRNLGAAGRLGAPDPIGRSEAPLATASQSRMA